MSADVQVLQEMGFSKNRAERALYKTGYKGVQLAMDWLFAHEDDADIDDPFTPPQGQALGSSSESTAEPSAEMGAQTGDSPSEQDLAAMAPKSLKCDDCGKLLKSELDAQAHAARTQHTNFSESTEEIKPLTEEEKKERLNQLQEKLKQRRLEREEKEAKEQLAKEKARRTSGREIVGVKQKFEEDEIKRLAEQRRREKMEDKLARQRIKEQIEKDKADRAAKFPKSGQQPSPAASAPAPVVPATAPAPATAPPAARKEYEECRLQIRLPSGQALTQTFKAKEPLGAVRLFVEMNRQDGSGPFSFMTTFPRKVFTDEDMEVPLDALGLVPSAVLMVRPA